MKPKYWCGPVREKDDFEQPIVDTFIDGKTCMGAWAIMTPAMYSRYGMGGYGMGRAQRYEKQADGRWLKVEG